MSVKVDLDAEAGRAATRGRRRPSIGAPTLTPLRRRILARLEQAGDMDIQEIGFEFSANPRGLSTVFKHPAAATRFGGMLTAPMKKAGWVEEGWERFAWRRKLRITAKGREALRRDVVADVRGPTDPPKAVSGGKPAV